MAPGAMPPLKRLPMTSCVAGAQRGDEGIEMGEVVAVVGVAHDDVAAARRLDAGRERRAIAARGHVDDARAGGGGDLPGCRRSSRCRRSALRRAMPVRSRKPRALPMQTASVSASLRQGIRMVSSRLGQANRP